MHETTNPSTAERSTVGKEYSPGELDKGISPRARNIKTAGFFSGIVLAFIVGFVMPESLDPAARMTAAIAIMMGVFWITEAIPLAATALLPLVLFPAMGVAGISDVAPSYASQIIFLFLGGFLLALGLQRWNLHKRIALHIVLIVGTKPTRLIAGFMIATAFLGMWVSNTATAMMMIPMAMSVVSLVEGRGSIQKKSKFGVGLVLAVTYAATISAFGTIIGSPVNVVAAGYIRETLGYSLNFLEWMAFGMPLVIIFLVLGWAVIAKWLWRPEVDELEGGKELFQQQLKNLGKMSGGEKVVGVIFGVTAMAWIFVPFIWEDTWANDSVIAMMAGIAVFVLPARPSAGVMVLDWESAKKVPWDVLILFGGGLALSAQITGTGLAAWMGESLAGLGNLPTWALLLVVVALLLFLTELTSSTATASAFVPVVGGIAQGIGQDPILFALAASMACLCAFMLPVGTPPNAVAFGSGAVTIAQMMRTGLWMNLLAIVLVTSTVLVLVPLALGL